MSTDKQTIIDCLGELADSRTQKAAAHLAQDVFAEAFRLAVSADGDAASALNSLEQRCQQWCQAAEPAAARSLRLALLISGLDQWGVAYSQAFTLNAIPALTTLIGALRNGLPPADEARFQQYFQQLDTQEEAAIDFKVGLRRHIHLALWHAMAACSDESASTPIVQTLGGLLLAVDKRMPTHGWRLVADALANIQIGLLTEQAPSAIAQSGTEQLFAALRHALPQERYRTILAHATQAVIAWQQAQREASPLAH